MILIHLNLKLTKTNKWKYGKDETALKYLYNSECSMCALFFKKEEEKIEWTKNNGFLIN